MVEGTDDSYIDIRTFNKAWNHQDQYERLIWRNPSKKEFNNMFKHNVRKK